MPLVLDPHLRARLEKLAEASGCTASELASAVLGLGDSLDENERELAAIDAGIEEADAGQLIDYDDVKASVDARFIEENGILVFAGELPPDAVTDHRPLRDERLEALLRAFDARER
jgi:predicted transcriptional regulator